MILKQADFQLILALIGDSLVSFDSPDSLDSHFIARGLGVYSVITLSPFRN